MSEPFNWRCPFCDRDTTITYNQHHSGFTRLEIENNDGFRELYYRFIVCPNKNCRKFTLVLHLYESLEDVNGRYKRGKHLNSWNLIPSSNAKVYPDYVPNAIIADYQEACLIKNLSPKASATLSRRCLQGIIRDYWNVKEKRLVDEIAKIRDKTDTETWEAIDAVRKVGNIGAHMEKDIDLIIDVEPNEANLLISLIETLIEDWYIARHKREEKLKNVKAIADDKERIRNGEMLIETDDSEEK